MMRRVVMRGMLSQLRRAVAPALMSLTLAAGALAADEPAPGPGKGAASVVRQAAPPPAQTATPAANKGLPAASGWQSESDVALAESGGSVAALGDVNGDGFGDFAAGGAGAVRVFYGSPAGLATTPSQTITNAISSFGARVAPAGDVNGDGYFDLLVSAPFAGDGRVYCYHGSAAGLSAAADWTYSHLDAGFASAQCGQSIDSAGDLNGDGYDDVVAGIPFSGDGKGGVVVFHGGPSGLNTAVNWSDYATGSVGYGTAVAGAGDVNADGYADVAVSMPYLSAFIGGSDVYGVVYVYHGGPGGLSIFSNSRAYGYQASAFFGAAVAGAGDVNGDGYADLVVGQPYFDYPGVADAGRAAIYPGSAAGVVNAPIWEEYGVTANKQFGAVVATAGDVDGDGLADVAIGVPVRVNNVPNNGSAYLVQGGTYPYIAWSTSRFDGAGFASALGTAGDVNNDGFSDLLVGSPLFTNGQSGEGRVEIFFGAANPPAAYAAQFVNGGQEDSGYTWVTTSVGDVNGDGYSDAVATAPWGDWYWYDEGVVHLYGGSPNGLYYGLSWGGEYEGSDFGYSAASAGDVNGDGYGDLIIGSPNAGAGLAYVWHGGPFGPSAGAANWVVSQGVSGGRFGHSVASAGDVNGDGYGDVIVGAPLDSNGEAQEGRAYVFLGSPSGLSTSPAWIVEGNQVGAWRGRSVACAGDVNRDGFSDVIVGEPLYDHFIPFLGSIPDAGRALAYLGGAGGLATTPVWSRRGDWGHQFGTAVASAGDVDGDGYSDVLVTAINAGATAAGEGGAYVFRGGPGGPSVSAHWSYVGLQAGANVGTSASGGGDVNGDGLSDVIVGAPNFDGNGGTDNGQALLFAGPLTGAAATTPLWSYTDPYSYQDAGQSVSANGDYNGDGFADILTGAPYFSQDAQWEGRLFVFYSNGLYAPNQTLARVASQRRGNDSAPIALFGRPGSPPSLRVKALGGSAAGRAKVRLEWEIEPLGSLTDGFGLGRTAWVDNGASPAYAPPLLDSGSLALPSANTAHWRLRVASRSPRFPNTPWLSVPGNGRQEGDVRVRNSLLTSVDGPARPLGGALPVSAAPNPFNPRTTIAFENARAGHVRVELFDLRGRLLGVVLDEERPAGRVELTWDGRDGAGRDLASGSYFARVTAGGRTGTARLTLLR